MSDSTRDYRVICLSETLGPCTHAKGTAGNESLIAREPVVTGCGVAHVPCLSGNAIRHRMIREPGARWLVTQYDLRGKLTLQQLNFLFHGGNLTEGGGRENTVRIAEFQRLFPLGRLVGGALPDQILAGSLQVWRGALVCEENRGCLGAALGEGDWLWSPLRPAETFVGDWQYTRGDAATTASDLAMPNPNPDESPTSNLMIFAGQFVIRGAAFLHGFTLSHVSILELGALLWSLSLWQSAGGTIGGQASRGHGRLALSYLEIEGVDAEAAIDAYLDHARSVREDAVAWLHDVFKPRAEKAAKGKSGKGAA